MARNEPGDLENERTAVERSTESQATPRDPYEPRWGFEGLRRELLLKDVLELESGDLATIRTFKVVSTHPHYAGKTWITDVACTDGCEIGSFMSWSRNPVRARLRHAEVTVAIVHGAKTFDDIHNWIDR